MPREPVRSIRIDDTLWKLAQGIAALAGTEVPVMVREDLTRRVLAAVDDPATFEALADVPKLGDLRQVATAYRSREDLRASLREAEELLRDGGGR